MWLTRTGVRQRERDAVRWLHEAPWRAGRYLAETVSWCRRLHTESIARQSCSERSVADGKDSRAEWQFL